MLLALDEGYVLVLIFHQDTEVCKVLALHWEFVQLSDMHQTRIDVNQLLSLNTFRSGFILRFENLAASPFFHFLFPKIQVAHEVVCRLNRDCLLIFAIRQAPLRSFSGAILRGIFLCELIQRILLLHLSFDLKC